mmetsp:Transcript_34889/g.54889  ORF Transcript_34889/g.54889 Transcript_34889/m.54889 type:complete len:365 (+) Transcript_34889:60-1154(+)
MALPVLSSIFNTLGAAAAEFSAGAKKSWRWVSISSPRSTVNANRDAAALPLLAAVLQTVYKSLVSMISWLSPQLSFPKTILMGAGNSALNVSTAALKSQSSFPLAQGAFSTLSSSLYFIYSFVLACFTGLASRCLLQVWEVSQGFFRQLQAYAAAAANSTTPMESSFPMMSGLITTICKVSAICTMRLLNVAADLLCGNFMSHTTWQILNKYPSWNFFSNTLSAGWINMGESSTSHIEDACDQTLFPLATGVFRTIRLVMQASFAAFYEKVSLAYIAEQLVGHSSHILPACVVFFGLYQAVKYLQHEHKVVDHHHPTATMMPEIIIVQARKENSVSAPEKGISHDDAGQKSLNDAAAESKAPVS